MSTRQLQKVLADLEGAIEALDIGRLSDEEQVTVGYLLWALGQKTKAALGPVKTHLRKRALSETDRPGPVWLYGTGPEAALVVVQSPRPAVRKGADLEPLQTALDGRFADYFETVTTHKLRKDFETRASKHPTEAAAVLTVVDYEEGLPRVTFKDQAQR